jgi:homoserine dehydrogenase
METEKKLTIGLFGFGTVGQGLWDVTSKTKGLQCEIKKIVVKQAGKQRALPDHYFTTDKNEILNDDDINVVVELIDDADAAFDIVATALRKGKAVVSANKKMIAHHLQELIELQKQFNAPFLYEASTCASIPIIRNLEEYYDVNLLHGFAGIVNGSTNYILTKMLQEKQSYQHALADAQAKGFAESNPKLDVEGYDAVNKLTILLIHAFGLLVKPEDILFTGIQHLKPCDAQFALQHDYRIRLVAQAYKQEDGSIASFVLPQFVQPTNELFETNNEFNAIVLETAFSDRQFFKGKGAGGSATASAVLADLAALRYDYRYEYKQLGLANVATLCTDCYLHVFVSAKKLEDIPVDYFEHVEEWHNSLDHVSMIGVVTLNLFKKIIENNEQYQLSIVLMPLALVNDIEVRRVKKKSLALAGIK